MKGLLFTLLILNSLASFLKETNKLDSQESTCYRVNNFVLAVDQISEISGFDYPGIEIEEEINITCEQILDAV